jgi:phosphatidylethanolamine-binding protein (PEBP) family uncharacterized protein
MRRATYAVRATPILALLAALTLSGCGGAASGGTSTAAAPVHISLTSSALHGSQLPALYTCDGRDVSPPLSWSALPSDVEEVAIFALAAHHTASGQTLASIEWALAGVRPGLRKLKAGEVPHGAFLLANSASRKRYSVCPRKKGETLQYTFGLYALPHGAHAGPAITSTALFENLTESGVARDQTPATGSFRVNYTRR